MSFKKDFLWGAATAAHQVEGAYLEDGKTLNVWDALVNDKRVKNGENGKVACDHYHRFREDVALMKEIGLNSYRFSVSWARIIPNADGKINEKGVRFYKDLVTELVNAGIEPLCTLYHWDMPMWAYERGGWKNPEVVKYFSDYTEAVVDALSDKVKYWFTFNEPQCFVGCGHVDGFHAPFEKVTAYETEIITRNVMLSHGSAVKIIRKYAKQTPYIGFAPTASLNMPTKDGSVTEEDAYEFTFDAKRFSVSSAAWWADPIVLGKRPDNMGFLSDDDLKEICQPLDFYAFNIYTLFYPEWEKYDGAMNYAGAPKTSNGWLIVPDCIYWAAKFFYKRYGLPILCSENGIANADFVMSDGKVHDPQRAEYLKAYLSALLKASDEGVPVIGYQYWSLIDNFEWSAGYDPRFGLVYVDYKTQKRTIKDSAYYYKKIIESNGDILI
ncbi:MAG: family 1 glycosylhydrolase [Clostridia bacterium]|nr:family 1 glycosylhydrolase [Clostridia bacterium]